MAKRDCPTRKTRVDWEAIETRYESGEETYDDLAQAYGIHIGTVARNGKQRHWPLKRQAFRAQVQRKASNKVLKRKADLYAEVAMRSASGILRQLNRIEHMTTAKMEKLTATEHAQLAKAREQSVESLRKLLGVDKLDVEDGALTIRYAPANSLGDDE